MSTKTPHLETFASEYHMLKFFGKYLPKLDVDKSAKLSPFLYVYDTKMIFSRGLFDFLTQMEELTALDINTRASVQKNRAFLVFFDNKPKDPSVFVSNSTVDLPTGSTVITEKVAEASEGAVTTAVTLDIPAADPDPVIETVEESTPVVNDKAAIIAEAEALRDDTKKAASKVALEAFGLSHGISLSRAKTFDDMLEDLKAALA